MRDFKEKGPTLEELERAKNRVLASFIYAQETSEGLARTIGSYQIQRGSYKDILWYIKEIEKATSSDLQELAKKWLNEDKLVVVFLSEKALFNEETFKNIIQEVK